MAALAAITAVPGAVLLAAEARHYAQYVTIVYALAGSIINKVEVHVGDSVDRKDLLLQLR